MTATATASATTTTATFAPADTRMASLRAIYIIWYRDILRYWRDRWRLVASLAQPLLFLIVFGSGLGSALGRGTVFGAAGGFSYIQFVFPGIVGMAILFSAIFTLADFNIVYVLTKGGPMNMTHLFATYSFALGLQSGQIGQGAAVSLFLFPILLAVVFVQLRLVRKSTTYD